MTKTLEHARRLGAGAILVAPISGERYRVSDWSPSTGHVFGHLLMRDDQPGEYQELPAALEPERVRPLSRAWRYERATKTIRSVPENHWIASMDSFDGAQDHEANAALIARAPELQRFAEKIAALTRYGDAEGELGDSDDAALVLNALIEEAEALLAA
jgi:hypothetical protein